MIRTCNCLKLIREKVIYKSTKLKKHLMFLIHLRRRNSNLKEQRELNNYLILKDQLTIEKVNNKRLILKEENKV